MPRQALIGMLTVSGTVNDTVALSTFHLLRRLLADGRPVAGLIVRLASGGGSLAAAQAVVEQMQQLKDEAAVPVVTVVDDMAASAAFYIALHGDHVMAQPAALLGSVGAQLRRLDVSGLAQRLGVSDASVASTVNKLALDAVVVGNRPAQDAAAQALVADVHDQFVGWVAQRRPAATLPAELLDGRLFTGRAALAAGLVDELGGTAKAVAHVVRRQGLSNFALMTLESAPRADLLSVLLPMLPFGRFFARLFGRQA